MRTIPSTDLTIKALSIVISHHIHNENKIHRQRFKLQLQKIYETRQLTKTFYQYVDLIDSLGAVDNDAFIPETVRRIMLNDISKMRGIPLGICPSCHQHVRRIVDVDLPNEEDETMIVISVCDSRACPTLELFCL